MLVRVEATGEKLQQQSVRSQRRFCQSARLRGGLQVRGRIFRLSHERVFGPVIDRQSKLENQTDAHLRMLENNPKRRRIVQPQATWISVMILYSKAGRCSTTQDQASNPAVTDAAVNICTGIETM